MRRRKSRGLGDDIARFTEVTGIKAVVKVASKILDVDCGCEKRQEELNEYPSIKSRFKK